MAVEDATPVPRKVGILLGIGIFFLPIFFAWLTLRKGHSTLARVISFVWLAFFLIIGVSGNQDSTTSPGKATSQATAAPPKSAAQLSAEALADRMRDAKRHPEKHLTLNISRGTVGGFGVVLIVSGELRNDSPIAIKDPKIRCTAFGNSGTEIGSPSATLYEIVPAEGTKRFRELNVGFVQSQIARYTCEVVGATASE